METCASKLDVLYEDNHIIAVCKPAGLLVMSDDSGDPTLVDLVRYYLKTKYEKPGKVYLGVVHRLDRPVGGVILFARTSKAAARLQTFFREGAVKKIYLAVCSPPLHPPSGEMDDHLLKNRKINRTEVVTAQTLGARRARLLYRTLKTSGDRSLLEIQLLTGRSHQIRVQLAHRGTPLVGDHRYGKGDAQSPMLFSKRIELSHPVREEKLIIEAEPPQGLLQL